MFNVDLKGSVHFSKSLGTLISLVGYNLSIIDSFILQYEVVQDDLA